MQSFEVFLINHTECSKRRVSRINDDGKAANSLRIRNLENACEEKFVTPHAYPPSSFLLFPVPSVSLFLSPFTSVLNKPRPDNRRFQISLQKSPLSWVDPMSYRLDDIGIMKET